MYLNPIVWLLSWFYMFAFISLFFEAPANAIRKKSLLVGQILFLFYALFVYYRGFGIPIPIADTIVNEPIKVGLDRLFSFIDMLTGIDLTKSNPNAISLLLDTFLPAIFIYNLAIYWVEFLTLDPRIARLVGILAAAMFLYGKSWSIGLTGGAISISMHFLAFLHLSEPVFSPWFDFVFSAGGTVETIVMTVIVAIIVAGLIFLTYELLRQKSLKKYLVLFIFLILGLSFIASLLGVNWPILVNVSKIVLWFFVITFLLPLLGDTALALALLLMKPMLRAITPSKPPEAP